MGTADGTTPHADGVRVFFLSGPTVTAGTGTVDVANEDGTATITAAGQAYFQYAGTLAPSQTSAAKLWSFNVPPTVTTFTFTVLVNARVPDEAGVLRWVVVPPPTGLTTTDFGEIAEAGGELWAVGSGGKIIRYTDAAGWVEQPSGVTATLHSVEMVPGTPITGVVVGGGGTILYYNGTTWANHTMGGGPELMSVARAGTQWFACSLGGSIYTSANGTVWTPQTSNTSADLNVCGGPAADNVFAAGGVPGSGGPPPVPSQSLVTHFNGTAWSSTGYNANTTEILRAAAACGSPMSNLWLGGDAGVIRHATTPFMNFTAQTSGTTQAIFGMESGLGCNDVYAVGANGTVLHWNGTSWSAHNSGIATTLNDVAVRIQNSGGTDTFRDAWAVGNGGMLLHGIR
jgi:hypothetical protein